MYPETTYELAVKFDNGLELKARVVEWLRDRGVESFVEGSFDNLWLDAHYEAQDRDFYSELGGDATPVSIYKYEREYLDQLRVELEHSFGGEVNCAIVDHATKNWLEGWRDSFLPICTSRFVVHPPWCESVPGDGRLVPLVIEPAMAFGTGQHASTILCLEEIEALDLRSLAGKRIADIGTGTGILAIAASKLGFEVVQATDIDPDAVVAARRNAELNAVQFPAFCAKSPEVLNGPFDVVVANILLPTLREMLESLSTLVADGGLLIMSGFLRDDAVAFTPLLPKYGLCFHSSRHKGDWCCLVLRKVQ